MDRRLSYFLSKTGTEMMQVTTFDGWDARYCGDALALPGDVLAHWRTKGSKNGVRRYQQPDGTWTPLGLRERRLREGWGESKAEKKAETQAEKAAKRLEKSQRRIDRANARDQARQQRQERIQQRRDARSLRNVSDEELQRRISRVKLEREYKELTRNPLLVTGEKIIDGYMKAKKDKRDREVQDKKLEKELTEARARLVTAEADKAFAAKRGNVKARKYEAKAKLKKEKNQERKQTIRGAISQVTHDILSKRGTLHVKKIERTYGEILTAGPKKVKKILDRNREKMVNDLSERISKNQQRGSFDRASNGLFGNGQSPKVSGRERRKLERKIKREYNRNIRRGGRH